jgi:hypothetical protein
VADHSGPAVPAAMLRKLHVEHASDRLLIRQLSVGLERTLVNQRELH